MCVGVRGRRVSPSEPVLRGRQAVGCQTHVHVSEERNSSSVIRSENSSSSSSSSSRSSELAARVGWQKADTRQAQGRQAGRQGLGGWGRDGWREEGEKKGNRQSLKNHKGNRHLSTTKYKEAGYKRKSKAKIS